MRRSHYLVLILLLIAQTTFGQVYQNMAQPGYKFGRARFDSVLTIPSGLGNLKNISGGQDTGQIRFNKSDSSVYVWNGRAWIKPVGGGADTTKIPLAGTEVGKPITGDLQFDNAGGDKRIKGNASSSYIEFTDDGGININKDSGSNVNVMGVTFNGQNLVGSDGIKGIKNYSANYNSLNFIQKVYSDSVTNLKLNKTDTAAMLAPYSRVTVTSYGKNATADSTILLLSNGTRYAAKDSVGGGGSSGWSLTGNASAVTDFLGTTNNRTMRFRTNNVERMVIDSTGKVGIGTATPTTILDMLGTGTVISKLKSSTNTGVAAYQAINDANSSLDIGMWGSTRGTFGAIEANHGYIYGPVNFAITSTQAIKFGTGASVDERMRVTPAGRVLIGTTTENGSALLNVTSTTQGLLIPRMTLTQRNAIASPAAGLQVIVTGETGGEFVSMYNSTAAAWQRVGTVAGSTGQLQLNNAGALSATSNLFFNTGSQNLGVGTSTPLESIHVIKDSIRGSFFRMDSYNGAPGLQTYRVNGTVGSPTATESGNFIGLWGMRGYGTSLINYSSAYIGGRATQTWTTTANGTDLVFGTTQNGSNSASIRLTIGNDGLAAFANNATIAGTLGVTSGTSLSTLTTSGATTIGGLTPNASAILDVQSTTKTFLPPRMTGAQSLAIVSPAEGSLIYNTTSKALNVYNGTQFNRVVYSALTSVTSTYQILISDNTVLATSGTFTITMPNAVDSPGKILYIKNTGAGTITLASLLSQTFDGTTTLTSGVRVQYVSDGANWVQIN